MPMHGDRPTGPGRAARMAALTPPAALLVAWAATGGPMAERGFLDKMIAKRTARNPAFPQMLDAARRRQELLRTLAERREEQNQTQTAVAAAMATSQSFVAHLERTAADARSRPSSDMPGVSGAWCSTTSFPWTRAPTSRPSSFMRAHRFQRASDLRFGPGPRGG
jgi:hypothetical protein